MSILQTSLTISTPPHTLSSTAFISGPTHIFLTSKFSQLSIAKPPKPTPIRMGGGPRTYPGGVSKWQWKRMQAKKAKQLLKARLSRERQIYEMRKRAELKAAISELERPWEVVEKAPNLFSTSADEQVKVLADRFQRPGGFDMWSEKDGPQLFETLDNVPSARFFPKGVVHSIKPYGKIADSDDEPGSGMGFERDGYSSRMLRGALPSEKVSNRNGGRIGVQRNGYQHDHENSRKLKDGNEKGSKVKLRKSGNRSRVGLHGSHDSTGWDTGRDDGFDFDEIESGRERMARSNGGRFSRGKVSNSSEAFDMSLQHDGSYGFSRRELEYPQERRVE